MVYSSGPVEGCDANRLTYRRTPARLTVRNGPAAGVLRVAVWAQTALPYRVRRDRADVIFCPMPEGIWFRAVPQVVVVHDLLPLVFPDLFGRLRQYIQYVLPRVLAASDRIIAISQHTKSDLISHLGVPEEKIEVVHLGINPLFFSGDPGTPPKTHEAGPFFLFVGRCHPHKNIETVLRAYADIHQRVPETLVAVLDFYGEKGQAYFEGLQKQAALLGIANKLRFYSHINARELLFLYRNATALLLLSNYEGFGLPPMEAMAVGTPAIVSDSSSLAEVAGPGAICVASWDHLRAAQAMQELALDGASRACWSKRAGRYASQFTWERTAERIRGVLYQCAR